MKSDLACNQLSDITLPLLCWYHSHARILPWREDPRPYYVWISEIMLQQTRVEAVKPYFDRFIDALPNIKALAEIPTDDLLKLWEGLGYYNRARNLKKAAQLILENYDGKLPANYDELLKLPGIGRYTAGAISSIAYHISVPAVDGNVLRVISRLLASYEDIMKESTRRKIEKELQKILPSESVGDFNQALMELGAMICLPKGIAKCPACPLKQICLAYANDLVLTLPIKASAKARRLEKKTIFRIIHQDSIALHQRPNKGLLAGMWELPNLDGHLSLTEVQQYIENLGLTPKEIVQLSAAKHIFTHIEWAMIGYEIRIDFVPPGLPFIWISHQELLDDFAVPTAFRLYLSNFLFL